MPKHDWVKDLLENWARWVTERNSGGLGFPRQSPFMRLGGSAAGPDGPVIPVDDVDARRTHDAVESLRLTRSHLYLVVCCRWIGDPRQTSRRRRPLTLGETAAALCCSDSTVKNHVTTALAALAELLSTRERSFKE